MTNENFEKLPLYRRINWLNASFLTLSPLIVIIGLPLYFIYEGFDLRLEVMFLFFAIATSLSITAGYHRLFSHRSYEASVWLRLFYLIFGSAALEDSALKWSADHRRHHRHVDTEEDPYAIQRGFFYAHMGWVYFKDDPRYEGKWPADLKADKLVMWQHRNNFAIAIFVGFLAPTLIGLSFGAPWGGLLFGCLARVVFTHHCTFFINSLCHMWGSQPYGDKTTARDNFVLAFLTQGEGYHNFHHRFEADYRNGIKWYHWDPTKWWIRSLSFFGMTKRLRKISDAEILRARLQADEKRLVTLGSYNERLQEIRNRIEEAQKKLVAMKARYAEIKRGLSEQTDEAMRLVRMELAIAKVELEASLEQWKLMCRAQLAVVTSR